MALIGYARVSTEDQLTARQLDELRTAGCSEIVEEHASGDRSRPVGHLALRGRRGALTAHEPLTEERHADPLACEYHAAYAKAEACDPSAISAFAALLGRDSSDGLVSFHLMRLLAGAMGVPVALE